MFLGDKACLRVGRLEPLASLGTLQTSNSRVGRYLVTLRVQYAARDVTHVYLLGA